MLVENSFIEKLFKEIENNPENAIELLKNTKFISAMSSEDDGIPPRFGNDFKNNPTWEKVTGVDFEIIGRVLVSHLCIEHYINNLLYLITKEDLDWDNGRLTFMQKFKLIAKVEIFKKNKFLNGIEIINKIRNKMSHNMLSRIDENEINNLHQIIIEFVTKDKTEEQKEKIMEIEKCFGPIAIIERFSAIVCAFIGGYCSYLTNKKSNPSEYYNKYRNESNDEG